LECMTCSKRANKIARDKLVFFTSKLSQEMLGEHQIYYLILDYYITEQTIHSLKTIDISIIEEAEKSDKQHKKKEAKRASKAANAPEALNETEAVNATEAKAPEKLQKAAMVQTPANIKNK